MRTRFGTILAAVAAALTAAAEDGTLLAETGSAATFRAWSSADATYAVMSAAELSSLMPATYAAGETVTATSPSGVATAVVSSPCVWRHCRFAARGGRPGKRRRRLASCELKWCTCADRHCLGGFRRRRDACGNLRRNWLHRRCGADGARPQVEEERSSARRLLGRRLDRRPLQGIDDHVRAAGGFGACGDHVEQDRQGRIGIHVQQERRVDGHAEVCRQHHAHGAHQHSGFWLHDHRQVARAQLHVLHVLHGQKQRPKQRRNPVKPKPHIKRTYSMSCGKTGLTCFATSPGSAPTVGRAGGSPRRLAPPFRHHIHLVPQRNVATRAVILRFGTLLSALSYSLRLCVRLRRGISAARPTVPPANPKTKAAGRGKFFCPPVP